MFWIYNLLAFVIGDFKHGFIDGNGTYSGPSGDTYKGSWSMNLRHGNGRKSYANGDSYDGDWQHGFQDGNGKYQWNSGDSYTGQWKNGYMHGSGTMIFKNNNRYDGCWEDGFPKGNGTYKWPDGSLYVGVWGSEMDEESGTYYPATDSEEMDWNPLQLYDDDLNNIEVSPAEPVRIFPSEKMPRWFEMDGEFLQKVPIHKTSKWNSGPKISVDGRPSDCSWSSDTDSFESRSLDWNGHVKLQPSKKQGETISKGHKNYELMLNLQLGIR